MVAAAFENTDYAPGMRVIIRDEEWMIRKVETNALGNKDAFIDSMKKWGRLYPNSGYGARFAS